MEFKKGDLLISENKSEDGIVKKILNKFKDIKKKAKSEIEETKALIRILTHAVKSYSKNREFDLDKKDIEFIKGQSADVIKNLLMVVISIIPIPIPVTPFLIIFGKKIGIDIVPKEHEIPEKGKKKEKIDEAVRKRKSKTHKTPEDAIKIIELVNKFTTPDIKKFLKNENINVELKDVKTKTYKSKDVFNHEAVIDITDEKGNSLNLSRNKKLDILELFHEYLILTGEGQNFPGGPFYDWDFVDSVDIYDDDPSLNESVIIEASKKKTLMDKVGLSEENAEYLERVCGPLSVWMANKVIDYQLKSMKSWVGFKDEELTKEKALERINSGNMMNVYGFFVTEIMDWIRIGLNGNVNEYKNLSLIQLGEESKRWHDSLGIGGGDINYIEKGDIVLDFRDSDGEGYYWVNTGTNDCNEESRRMGHCGRTNRGNTIWSLRNVKKLKDTYTMNNSVVTAAIGDNDGYVWQMKGPKNSKPKKEFHKYIIPLFYLKGENGYVIKGFGREYNSKNDFQIGDLDNSEIKELYQNRPDLFNDYKTKKLLVDLGVINKDELLTSFIVNIEPYQLRNFLGNDRRWGNGTFYEAILINSWEIWNVDLQYYEPEDLISSVDENNLLKIKKILSEENNEDLRDVPLDEILDYDGFDNIGEELRKSANTVDGDAYGDYLYGQLKKALEEYGKVISMNDEGIELEVDIKIIDDINDEDLSEFMNICNDNLECVFSEAIYVGSIDLPRPHFDDDWHNWNFDEQQFNEVLSDNLAEYL
jgi:hypothetical protein